MKVLIAAALGLFAMLILSIGISPGVAAAPTAALPATQGSSQKTETTTVRRGDIRLDIHAEGYFEPTDALEVRIVPKAYTGELKIAEIVENGAHVKKGDTLLRFESDDLDRQLSSAQNEATLAHANLDKARSDVALGDKADTLALAVQREHQSQADDSVTWWEKVDGPIQAAIINFQAHAADFQLEDSQEQLAELKKMYKSEELTNATTDIVMKRAIQEIEMGKLADTVFHERADEFNKFHYDILHHQVTDAASAAGQLVDQLQAQQTQSRTVRQTSLVGAQTIADAADRKVADLKVDGKALTVIAPSAGRAFYGQLSDGNWQNDDEKALRVGQIAPSKQVLMTFFTPGHLRATADLSEAQFFSIPPDAKAMVTPAAFAGASMPGTCETSVPQGHTAGTGVEYATHISLGTGNDRLIPGMRAAVSISAELAHHVLVVPLSAVSAGQVWVHDADGHTTAREVNFGASDQTNIEVRNGLAEGDTILTHARK